ncbi:hypothetical protein P43SY_003181 [Pythium insidiosum]|uniref:Uncharacterized protein n=1 Tax=Pythium insidiosum TaxID=114742 RepID=A0AAD5Q585_PYTIN|nr:hypothetical protein P43SY_003181 [Pythium insidiosum]
MSLALENPRAVAWALDARSGDSVESRTQSTPVHEVPPSLKHQASVRTGRAVDRQQSSSRLVRASSYRLPGKTEGNRDANDDEDDDDDGCGGSNDVSAAVRGAAVGPENEKKKEKKTAKKKTAAESSPLERSKTAPTGELKRATTTASALTVDPVALPSEPAAKELTTRRPRRRRSSVFDEMVESEDVVVLCVQLGLSKQDVWQLRRAFNSEDPDGTNTITLASFFFLINEEKRALTKSLLRLAQLSSPDATRLSFDEFLRCVATFASFTESEVLAFFFEVYTASSDKRSNRKKMDDSDLQSLADDLKLLQTAFARNVQVAASRSTRDLQAQRSQLTFADFERLSRQHSVAFFPLLQIQRNVRRTAGLGEGFWRAKAVDRTELERLLAFMNAHHGFQPPLGLRDWFCRTVLRRETATTRRRALAQRIYLARQQGHLIPLAER